MLVLAAILLGLAALGGLGLLALYQWVRPVGRWRLPGAAHGLVGVAGFALLLGGLSGPPRGVEMGAGSFGRVAAVLIGLAVVMAGVAFWARWRGSKAGPLALGLHATFAVGGLVLLAAYLSYPA
jgi:hypothetical protein